MKDLAVNIVKVVVPTILTTILLLMIFSFVMLNSNVSQQTIKIFVGVIYVLSTFVMGFSAGRISGHQKFVWGMAMGIVYLATILLISVLSGTDADNGVSIQLATFLCLVGGILGAAVS